MQIIKKKKKAEDVPSKLHILCIFILILFP